MSIYSHPTQITELEGIYVVKNNQKNKYVYLSVVFFGMKKEIFKSHLDIVNYLEAADVSEDDLFFNKNETLDSVFLEA